MEQLKLFIAKAKTDSELMAKINAFGANDANADEIIALAAEHGFTITAEDLNSCGGDCAKCGELSEEQLDAVAGGVDGAPTQNRYDPKVCPSLTRTRYECVGFFQIIPCDHYIKYNVGYKDVDGKRMPSYRHICVKDAFNYVGLDNGKPIL